MRFERDHLSPWRLKPIVMSLRIQLSLIVLMSVWIANCSQGQKPAETVEICLKNRDGVALFLAEMQNLANSNQMTFIDNSARTGRELAMQGQRQQVPVINISLEGQNGMGVTAGNLGLSRYQVALGFSHGREPEEGRRFTVELIQVLSQHWTIVRVPHGQGVLPSDDCG